MYFPMHAGQNWNREIPAIVWRRSVTSLLLTGKSIMAEVRQLPKVVRWPKSVHSIVNDEFQLWLSEFEVNSSISISKAT